jgi:hypothetical protein
MRWIKPKTILTELCHCDHKKNHHWPSPDGTLICQEQVFNDQANKMMQCGCKITFFLEEALIEAIDINE